MNRNKKLISKKKAVVTAMAGVLAIGGIMGASAFFTDQAHTDAKAHIGGLNMVVKDLSDLDGDYSVWDIDQVAGTIEEKDSVIDTAVGVDTVNGTMPNQTDRVGGNVTGRVIATEIGTDQATDASAPSTSIINPGDSGLLQFNVKNVDSKSFRTAMETSVVVSLADVAKEPDGTSATLQAAHKAGDAYAIADYDAYTIEGMGAPIVKFGTYDADTGVFTEAADDANATAMRLTYYTELDTLKGDVEDEASDGAENSLTYAFETKFNRLAQNKFMGATIDIKSDFYALQNRKTAGTWYFVTAENNAVDNTIVDAAGDWKQVGSFEKVINVVDGKTADLCENATSGMWYVG